MNQEETDNTFEQIKQNLLRISEMQERSSADFEKWRSEADKRLAEADRRAAEADKRAAELDKKFAETDRLIKANAKQIGGIDRSNGLMAEEAVYNSLSKNNTFANTKFDEMHKNVPVMSGFKTMTELDI